MENQSSIAKAIATVNGAIDELLTYLEKDANLTKDERQRRAYNVEKAWRTILFER